MKNARGEKPVGSGVQFQDTVLFQHDDGTMFSMSVRGGFVGDKQYPRLTSSPARIQLEPVRDLQRIGSGEIGGAQISVLVDQVDP